LDINKEFKQVISEVLYLAHPKTHLKRKRLQTADHRENMMIKMNINKSSSKVYEEYISDQESMSK